MRLTTSQPKTSHFTHQCWPECCGDTLGYQGHCTLSGSLGPWGVNDGVIANLQLVPAPLMASQPLLGRRGFSVTDRPLAKPTSAISTGDRGRMWCRSYPSPRRLGLLLREHLVAEVVRLDSKIVFLLYPLVTQDQKGCGPCHHHKHSCCYENDVTSPQAWLCTCLCTCGRDRDLGQGNRMSVVGTLAQKW